MSGRDDGITTIAPGVTRSDHFWGYDLKGTKDALLASGLAKEEWFCNGRRGKDGRRLTTVYFKIGGNRARCRPTHWTEGQYIVAVDYSKAEVEKQRLALRQGESSRKAKDLLELGLVMTGKAFNWENDPETAWRFPTETIEQVKGHLREIMQLFEGGGFEKRSGLVVESDAAFQRFIGRAVRAPSDSGAEA